MDTGSGSCDGSSERNSFRERQPAESRQLGKKQAVKSNTQRERTDTQPTCNEYNEWFFELRSAVVSIPTTAQMLFTWRRYLASYDSCQDTEYRARTVGYFGLQSDKLKRDWSVLPHTAVTRTKLFVCFERQSCAVACASSTADFQNSKG